MPFAVPVTSQKQEKGSDDCWACCASMALNAKNVPKTIDEVKRQATKFQGYELGARASLIETAWVIKKLSDGKVAFKVNHLGSDTKLDYGDFQKHLNEFRLILVNVGAHVVLVSGYTDGHLLIHDPNPDTKATYARKFSDFAKDIQEFAVMDPIPVASSNSSNSGATPSSASEGSSSSSTV